MTFPILPSGGAVAAPLQVQRSLRFNSADSAYLNRTPSVAGNRKTWTWSGWVKRSALTASDNVHLFGTLPMPNFTLILYTIFSDSLNLYVQGTIPPTLRTQNVYRDCSSWYHIVVSVDSTQATATNRAKLYINGVEAIYAVDNRASFAQNSDTFVNSTYVHELGGCPSFSNTRYFNGYLTEVNFIDGQALTPSSFGETNGTTGQWQPKKYTGTYGTNGFYLPFSNNSSVAALGYDLAPDKNLLSYSEQFDNAVWSKTNVLVSADATTAPNSTSTADLLYPASTGSYAYLIQVYTSSATTYTFSFYAKAQNKTIAWCYHYSAAVYGTHYVDLTDGSTQSVGGSGVSVVATNQGNGWWRVSLIVNTAYAGSANWGIGVSDAKGSLNVTASGTSGIYIWGAQLQLGSSATAYQQTVATSQQNNWTPNNFSVTAGAGNDSMIDVPTNWDDGGNGRGNYCTLNPLDKITTATLSNGNLEFITSTSGNSAVTTFGITSGKWYWEAQTSAGSTEARAGVYGTSASALYSFAANNTVYGFRFDAGTGALDYTTNGSSWTSLATGLTSGPYFVYLNNNGTTSKTITANFGQRPFAYTPPSGFKALNTQNIAAGTITTSGTFAGNVNANGPFVWLNGVPTAMTINGNAVTFGTHADKLSNGFKVRTSSTSYNNTGSNTYSITTTGARFKVANAQGNP